MNLFNHYSVPFQQFQFELNMIWRCSRSVFWCRTRPIHWPLLNTKRGQFIGLVSHYVVSMPNLRFALCFFSLFGNTMVLWNADIMFINQCYFLLMTAGFCLPPLLNVFLSLLDSVFSLVFYGTFLRSIISFLHIRGLHVFEKLHCVWFSWKMGAVSSAYILSARVLAPHLLC